MRSQLSLHHRLTHTSGCDVEPNVKMNCLAYTVDVIVEGQSVVYGHTETLYCSCNRNSNTGDYNVVDLWFWPLSSSGTNDDCFGFVWIQTKPAGTNQWWTDWKQSLIMLSALSLLREIYSWVLSAYWAWWTLCRDVNKCHHNPVGLWLKRKFWALCHSPNCCHPDPKLWRPNHPLHRDAV